jgi:protein SCO1/2
MKEQKKEARTQTNNWLIPAGIVLVVLGILGIGAYQAYYNPKPAKILETYGNQTVDSIDASGKPFTFTIVHQVPDFEFIDQNGEKVSQKNTEGKTYVADFFFTTCESICPIMSKEMMKLAGKYQNDPEIMFLSHTVDPETDSVPQLKSYAMAHQAKDQQWKFMTGSKKELYDMARKGYFVTATEGDGGADDFVHTQNFVLVDKFRHIRGYYDGTDSTEMQKLVRDIDLLKAEYKWKEKEGKE